MAKRLSYWITMNGTGGDIDVYEAEGPRDDGMYSMILWFDKLRSFQGPGVVIVYSIKIGEISFEANVPEWILQGWEKIAPNVFVDYWLERDDIPDWMRQALEQLQWP